MSTLQNLKLFVLLLMTPALCHSFATKEKQLPFKGNEFLESGQESTHMETTHQNPEELGAYFEGDILMPSWLDTRNGLLGKNFRWPKRVIPFEIHGNFTSQELAIIDWALDKFHKKTCIRFKPRSGEKDYISIVNRNSGCWSAAGRIGGKQEVNFQTPQCIQSRGTILHEFMHVLGFMHEHNRHDRDNYISIHTENIKKDKMKNFQKLSKTNAHGMGIGYDYTSVMHYSPKSFSKNGEPTIETKMDTNEAKLMGQRNGFSTADVAKINVMYKCNTKDLAKEEETVK